MLCLFELICNIVVMNDGIYLDSNIAQYILYVQPDLFFFIKTLTSLNYTGPVWDHVLALPHDLSSIETSP